MNHRRIWAGIGLICGVTALLSLINLKIYLKVSNDLLMTGTISQDVQTLILSLVLILISKNVKKEDFPKQLVAIGIIGYLAYAYGIYAFEQYYTVFYFNYLMILMLTLFELVYTLKSLETKNLNPQLFSKRVRITNLVLMITIPVIFNILWSVTLINLIRTGTRTEYFYSIYVIDLCFIMPAMLYSAYRMIKRQPDGYLFSTSLLIFGAAMMFPVGWGEFLKPHYGFSIDFGGVTLFLGLSVIFSAAVIQSLRSINKYSKGEMHETTRRTVDIR
jgi:uncharacterized membrane protein YiaA